MLFGLFGRPRSEPVDDDRLRTVEKRLAQIELEWADTLEKIARLYARIKQRAARELDPPEPAAPPANGDRQAQLNAAIHARRRGVPISG